MGARALPAEAAPGAAGGCRLCGARDGERLFEKDGYAFVRCRACTLVALDPLPTPAVLAAHHEASYRDGGYSGFAAAEAVRTAIAEDRLARIRPLAPAGPWLDVGCSTGAFVAAAARAGLPVEGLEVSSVAAEAARARGLVVHHAAVEDFAPAAPLAVVTAFDVIEHLPEPVAFGRRVRAWLRPEGVLAMTLPNIASPTARLMGRQWFYYAAPDHVHYFTPATIRRLLADAGFDAVTVEPTTKPLTLDYAAEQLERMTPVAAPLARAVRAVTPRALGRRLWPLPLGEMLVVARAVGS
jgi:2-polyprenyl-3-methyl-5-hydroxy-6-metoxy-1,4-benzoquinol methylase